MPALDNPTKTFEEWCASKGFAPEAKRRGPYNAYKAVNDQLLAQKGIYNSAFAASTDANATLNAAYGGKLITALSASDLLRKRYNKYAGALGRQKLDGSTPLQLGDGSWFGEQAGWSGWFSGFNRVVKGDSYWDGAVKKHKSADYIKRETRREWETIAAPLIREFNQAQGTNLAGAYAKTVEQAPGFARGVRAALAKAAKPPAQLTESIRQTMGWGTGRPAGAPAGTTSPATGGLPWGTIAIVGVILVALGVGAYFIFRE